LCIHVYNRLSAAHFKCNLNLPVVQLYSIHSYIRMYVCARLYLWVHVYMQAVHVYMQAHVHVYVYVYVRVSMCSRKNVFIPALICIFARSFESNEVRIKCKKT
jgi:hypothetical protein